MNRFTAFVFGFAVATLIPVHGHRINFFQTDQSLNVGKLVKNDGKRISYAGAQMWNVITDSEEKRLALETLFKDEKITTWAENQHSSDIVVKFKVRSFVAKVLEKFHVRYEIMIPDIQKAIDEENPVPNSNKEIVKRQGHPMTWSAYHRLQDIYDFLEYLAKLKPTHCKVEIIGTTIEGRPLKVLKLSNGNPENKAIWLDGGMHAREWISAAAVTYVLNELVKNFERESNEMNKLDWYFLPVVNPDGYEFTHTTDRLWRKNRKINEKCHGVDLNRNFGYKWGGNGASDNPCSNIYHGIAPFSENETIAIRDYVTSLSGKIKCYVSLHSYGQYILYPWGYEMRTTPDAGQLHIVASSAAKAMKIINGAEYTVGPAAATLYPASGYSDDWAKHNANIKYTFTIELRDTGTYGFILPSKYIKTTGLEVLAAVRIFAAAALLA